MFNPFKKIEEPVNRRREVAFESMQSAKRELDEALVSHQASKEELLKLVKEMDDKEKK